MKEIEKMIRENRDIFEDQEPSSGHFERFRVKLAAQNRKRKTIRLVYRISRVAAVGLLAIMSSLWIYNELLAPEEQFMNLGDVNQEYREVEFFFTSQIDAKYEELKSIDLRNDETFKETMLEEIKEMDSVYGRLSKEMAENPGDERIIEAMIRHYQTKLEVISEILTRLKSYEEYSNTNINKQNQYESVKL